MLKEIKGEPASTFTVTFGAMGLFNRAFAQFMRENSNLWETAHLFKSRPNRCLFERVISVYHMLLHHGQKVIHVNSLCGNIYYHPKAFKNTDMNIKTRSLLVKVWQGR